MSMQLNRILNATTLGSLLALVVVGPVHAVDGVIEINQARVKANGQHFPFVISQPGSYRLTGNLDVRVANARMTGVAAENTTAILVTADDVTIDLNGFMITGTTVCSGSPLICSPTGSGIGIDASGQTGLAVLNGTVRGMGSDGLLPGLASSLADKVRARSNGGRGIQADTVANCSAIGNGGFGIDATTVTNSTANGNRTIGIFAITATGCTALSNGTVGIGATTATGCTASSNGDVGIAATTATGCTASANLAPQITATGVLCHNICNSSPCPGPCP